MRELFAHDSAAVQKVEELSKRLGVTEAATERFVTILGDQQVPIEQLPERLAEIAARHKELLARVERTASNDPRVQTLKEEAKAAIEAGKYDGAERLLNEAKDAAIGAARRLKEEVATQLRAGAEAAAENGALAMTRLRYRDAAGYFAEAVELLPEGSDEVRADYLNQQGSAAWRDGDYPRPFRRIVPHSTSESTSTRQTVRS
jgi:tetratricopeptide (TPR) repeat protein